VSPYRCCRVDPRRGVPTSVSAVTCRNRLRPCPAWGTNSPDSRAGAVAPPPQHNQPATPRQIKDLLGIIVDRLDCLDVRPDEPGEVQPRSSPIRHTRDSLRPGVLRASTATRSADDSGAIAIGVESSKEYRVRRLISMNRRARRRYRLIQLPPHRRASRDLPSVGTVVVGVDRQAAGRVATPTSPINGERPERQHNAGRMPSKGKRSTIIPWRTDIEGASVNAARSSPHEHTTATQQVCGRRFLVVRP